MQPYSLQGCQDNPVATYSPWESKGTLLEGEDGESSQHRDATTTPIDESERVIKRHFLSL